MKRLRKFWPFHLANLVLFIFFSCAGIMIARGIETQIAQARAQGAMEVIIKLPVKALTEIGV